MWNISLNVKFQATYTTWILYLYDLKDKGTKCNDALKKTKFIYFNYVKLYFHLQKFKLLGE